VKKGQAGTVLSFRYRNSPPDDDQKELCI